MSAALSKVSLLKDKEFKHELTETGTWCMAEGGWFESQLVKKGS